MVNRDEIILEVCGILAHQVDMKMFMFIPLWRRYSIMAAAAAVGFCLGGLASSLVGGFLKGGMVGSAIAAMFASAICEGLGDNPKRADELIRNGLTSKQKALFIEYVRIFFEGKHLIDTATTLSSLSSKKDQEAAIRRAVSIFFRNEMGYVVNYDGE